MSKSALPQRPRTTVLPLTFTLMFVLLVCCSALAAPRIALQSFVTGLSSPVDMETPRDGTGRLFLVEQTGKIRIVQNGSLLSTPFLDLSAKIEFGGEKGLLGLAFHPSYSQTGRFFVDYTRRVSGQLQSVIAEYHVSASDPNIADTTETQILVVDQPFDNHNGGQLGFGPDKYLYISFGDGGSGGDPFGNGQDLGVLLGKILRIDIDSGSPYAIPADNPFVGDPNAKGEIWAYGLRNPWKFSFDRGTKQLFAGDVGQDSWEEVDIIQKGLNYGWNIMEGFHCYNATTCNMTGLTLPIAEYSHSEGEAVIGGFVYRGSAVPGLRGAYVFGDYLSGTIWGLKQSSGTWTRVQLLSSGKIISGFGQDTAGELYLLDYGSGTVFKLVQG
ncbi:MAG TPA: PQQ-dependent sugar dehydrogenase [Terriglobales bacterium]|nr:PQQ-dependent sugar dehydrogenase [Terriglobales bacterium]